MSFVSCDPKYGNLNTGIWVMVETLKRMVNYADVCRRNKIRLIAVPMRMRCIIISNKLSRYQE